MAQAHNRDAMIANYEAKFQSMKILRTAAVEAGAKKIIAARARYEAVSSLTPNRVPWWFIGVLHYREASCDFRKNLANGQDFRRRTTLVPVGAGPWPTWEASAIWALRHEGFLTLTDWRPGACLYAGEVYNGLGYYNHGWTNPYLFAGTNFYSKGKYQEKFVGGRRISFYNAGLVDQQIGIAALIKRVLELTGDNPAPLTIWGNLGKLAPADKAAVTQNSRALKASGWFQDFCHFLGLSWTAVFSTFQQAQPYLTDWRTLTALSVLGGAYMATQVGAFNLRRAAAAGRYIPSGLVFTPASPGGGASPDPSSGASPEEDQGAFQLEDENV